VKSFVKFCSYTGLPEPTPFMEGMLASLREIMGREFEFDELPTHQEPKSDKKQDET
jgi:hypothetical protein